MDGTCLVAVVVYKTAQEKPASVEKRRMMPATTRRKMSIAECGLQKRRRRGKTKQGGSASLDLLLSPGGGEKLGNETLIKAERFCSDAEAFHHNISDEKNIIIRGEASTTGTNIAADFRGMPQSRQQTRRESVRTFQSRGYIRLCI